MIEGDGKANKGGAGWGALAFAVFCAAYLVTWAASHPRDLGAWLAQVESGYNTAKMLGK